MSEILKRLQEQTREARVKRQESEDRARNRRAEEAEEAMRSAVARIPEFSGVIQQAMEDAAKAGKNEAQVNLFHSYPDLGSPAGRIWQGVKKHFQDAGIEIDGKHWKLKHAGGVSDDAYTEEGFIVTVKWPV